MPAISVIVPVYNVEKYLKECLEALINQTFEDIEIVAVDDASTDNSYKILQEYTKKDNRIKVFKHLKNQGLSATRNTALVNSTGHFIMNCDADDIFSLDMCEKMYNAIKKHNVEIAICGIDCLYETPVAETIKESDKNYYSIKKSGVKKVDDNLILSINASFCSKIVSSDLIKKAQIKFPEGLRYEDAYFHFIIFSYVDKVCFIPENLYKYRRRANSIMTQTFNNGSGAADHLKIAIAIYKYYKKHNILNEKYELFWHCFCDFYWFSIRYTKDNVQIANIQKMAKKFIKENCNFADCSNKLKENIMAIYGYSNIYKKIIIKLFNFIPIFCIAYSDTKYIFKLLGISILKIKQKSKSKKIYFLGLPIFKIVKKG